MDLQTFGLILFALIGAVGAVVYFLTKQIKNLKEELHGDDETVLVEWLKEMKVSVDKSSDILDRQLKDHRTTLEEQLKQQRTAMGQQTKMIWERLDNASEVIRNVQQHIGGIQEFGKDIKDLSNVLKSPKMRGGLGEQFLYEILAASLPNDLFKTQFKFKDGNVCDAVVYTEKGIIPIDSKFPMENFKAMVTEDSQEKRDSLKKVFIRDVKKRIEEISSKYILPEEGTTDFAVMYVPSENVYYEILVNTPEIEDYAKKQNVFITSPNTLNYQVKAILVAYQQNEIQKQAGDILKALSGIKIEAEKFEGDLSVLDRHLSNAGKSMENVRSKFGRLFGKIENVQSLDKGKDTEQMSLLD